MYRLPKYSKTHQGEKKLRKIKPLFDTANVTKKNRHNFLICQLKSSQILLYCIQVTSTLYFVCNKRSFTENFNKKNHWGEEG